MRPIAQAAERAAGIPPEAAGDSSPLVSLRHVGLSFGARRILNDVALAIAPGEIVTIIGPNGAGKTTLARLVLGLVKPDRGDVVLRPGLRTGYVPQRFPLDASIPLTVSRFMTLGRRAAPAAVEAALGETGAAHLLRRQASELSGGELQRVLLARALIGEPELLVLDEPIQAVDHAGEAQLYQLIAALRDRRGCGVLLISHDLHMVMQASDKVVCLNRHICCQGKPRAVANDPAYLQLFGLEGLDALGVYRHRHDHAHDLSGEVCDRTHRHAR